MRVRRWMWALAVVAVGLLWFRWQGRRATPGLSVLATGTTAFGVTGTAAARAMAAAPAASETAGDGATFGQKDDLTVISGIGPVLAERLEDLGITTFGQLADLDGADLERVRDALGHFRERIEREQWREQARALLQKGRQP